MAVVRDKEIKGLIKTLEDDIKDATRQVEYAMAARDEDDMELMQMHKQEALTRVEGMRRWCDISKNRMGKDPMGAVLCEHFADQRKELEEKIRKIDEK